MRSGKGFEDWSLDEIVEDYEKRVLSSMVKKGATLEEKILAGRKFENQPCNAVP